MELVALRRTRFPRLTSCWSVTAHDGGTRDLYLNEVGLYSYGSNQVETMSDADLATILRLR